MQDNNLIALTMKPIEYVLANDFLAENKKLQLAVFACSKAPVKLSQAVIFVKLQGEDTDSIVVKNWSYSKSLGGYYQYFPTFKSDELIKFPLITINNFVGKAFVAMRLWKRRDELEPVFISSPMIIEKINSQDINLESVVFLEACMQAVPDEPTRIISNIAPLSAEMSKLD